MAVNRGLRPSSLQCLLFWLFQRMISFIFNFVLVLVLQLPLSLPLALLTGSLFFVFFSPLSCEPGGADTERQSCCMTDSHAMSEMARVMDKPCCWQEG